MSLRPASNASHDLRAFRDEWYGYAECPPERCDTCGTKLLWVEAYANRHGQRVSADYQCPRCDRCPECGELREWDGQAMYCPSGCAAGVAV